MYQRQNKPIRLRLISWLLFSFSIGGFLSFNALAETLKVGVLVASGTQRTLYESVIKGFQQANPDIQIELVAKNDKEYKSSLNQWIKDEEGPDVLGWQGGERLYQYVRPGHIEALDDLWAENAFESKFSQGAKGAVTLNGSYYAMPMSYYQWGIYYRKSIFKKLNVSEPETWDEFLRICALMRQQDIVPITIGTKYHWPAAAWFDYLDLRLNGLNYHQRLLKGEIPFTDQGVVNIFNEWKNLLDKGYFVRQHNNWKWSEAMPFIYHKLAGMTLIGNFFAAELPEILKEDFGFFRFPEMSDKHPMYEEAPLDLFMIPKYSTNKNSAKKFLLYLSNKDFLASYNETLGMISPNVNSQASSNYFIRSGSETLNSAAGLSQFFDRDTSSGMANAATKIFSAFIDNRNIGKAIRELEAARKAHLLN